MRLHKKARDALEQNLMTGETVEVIITGLHNQAIVGTSRRAFVYKKGFMAGASFGSELTSWEYRHLVGVQLHTGMLSGAVVLQGPGQAGTSTSYWQSRDSDPLKAPNAIPVARPWDQAQHGVARLRELIGMAHRDESSAIGDDETARAVDGPGASAAPPGGGAFSTSADAGFAEQPNVQLLRDLAELRDAGILSEKEFEAKKADVLKRL